MRHTYRTNKVPNIKEHVAIALEGLREAALRSAEQNSQLIGDVESIIGGILNVENSFRMRFFGEA